MKAGTTAAYHCAQRSTSARSAKWHHRETFGAGRSGGAGNSAASSGASAIARARARVSTATQPSASSSRRYWNSDTIDASGWLLLPGRLIVSANSPGRNGAVFAFSAKSKAIDSGPWPCCQHSRRPARRRMPCASATGPNTASKRDWKASGPGMRVIGRGPAPRRCT